MKRNERPFVHSILSETLWGLQFQAQSPTPLGPSHCRFLDGEQRYGDGELTLCGTCPLIKAHQLELVNYELLLHAVRGGAPPDSIQYPQTKVRFERFRLLGTFCHTANTVVDQSDRARGRGRGRDRRRLCAVQVVRQNGQSEQQ